MALQDAEYYSCVSTQSTASEEAEVCLGLGDDIGINITVSIGDELPWDNELLQRLFPKQQEDTTIDLQYSTRGSDHWMSEEQEQIAPPRPDQAEQGKVQLTRRNSYRRRDFASIHKHFCYLYFA